MGLSDLPFIEYISFIKLVGSPTCYGRAKSVMSCQICRSHEFILLTSLNASPYTLLQLLMRNKAKNPPPLTVLSLALMAALSALALTPTAAQADQTISSTTGSQVNWTSGNVTITGSGLVSVTTTAVSVGGSVGALTNSGVISAGTGYAGISNFGESVTAINNIGTIGGGDYGISNVNGTIATLTNSGTISGINSIFNYNGTIGTLTNSGLITGSVAAIYNRSSGLIGSLTNSGTIAGNVFNASSHNLTINGGTGATFGTMTGVSGGIGSGNIGILTNTASQLIFGAGNQLLNDNINVGSSHTVTNSAATLQLNNHIGITGNYQQNAAASLLIGVADSAIATGNNGTDSGYGHLVVTGNAGIAAGSSVGLKALNSYAFAQGQRFVVVQAHTATYNEGSLNYTATGFSGTITGSSVVDGSYTDLLLTLSAASVVPSGGGSGGSGSGGSGGGSSPINSATTSNATASLGGLFNYSGTNAGLLAVFNPAAALGNAATANSAGAQLSPAAVSGAAVQASNAAAQAVFIEAATHVDHLRTAQANGDSGVATGESTGSPALWGQAFGGQSKQDLRDNVAGYHAGYNGVLIGADTTLSDSWRAGGLLSYANTSVASDGDNAGSSVHVVSYGLAGYASYAGAPWYLNLMAGAARQQYNTVRTIGFAGFSGANNGSFKGMQYTTSMQAGYPLNLDAWMPGTTLTPLAGLSYSTLRQDGYVESGSAAALNVNAANSNSLKSELGVKLDRAFASAYGKIVPSLQASWRHEYHNTRLQSGASFAADTTGATSFTTQSASPIPNTGVLALGVTLIKSQNLSISARYTLEAASGYTAQTGDVLLRWQY
jgi:outer membrane autotransporter protein